MRLQSIQAAEKKLVLNTYERYPILFTSGHGVFLTDENGVDYLDLLSGIGVSALGYGHPTIERAIAEQSKKLLHTSNLFFTEHTADLALRLTEISGLDRVFFCNSGTEAWEAALKIARAHSDKSGTGKKFLALEHSFHGRTIGSVATTHKLAYRTPFAPVMPDVEFVKFNDVEDLRAKFNNEVCGILIEAIQGEGGIHPVTQEFFAAARELADSTGALLIADEIQCGFGRTGKWFGYQHFGILPDVVTLAKPLAGGLPIGAMLCTERVSQSITPGMHGTTFGGGPLATGVAIAVIDEIKHSNLLAHIEEVGAYFKSALQALAKKHPQIVEVRGKGLMIGAELDSPDLAKSVASEMLARHIIINRTSEVVLRFLPPYILEKSHVDQAIAALDAILTQHAEQSQPIASGEHANG
ncbi:aspartate aminotransferase family protein [Granulicella tundricola]|uniref:Acetylornithine aminotransferase n=1 Tax=Granulicella tundricola (strain ATCC BAA-1859 / DSM 23138 / MP5ACTX9) TaxID=1198114 RepID=E8X051_GRATM|nr:aspartate aminotransferase family protein [Granulicella tundricola]ADW68947.1 acetylornithine and succinylornithine aminotransferase [Granulicella tundricola MP5ACTX9]